MKPCRLILSLLSVFTLGIAANAAPHKLRVNDPAAATALLASGGKLIADYGGFQLIEADTAAPALTTANGKHIEVDANADFIELHAARLNTRDTQVQSHRKKLTAFAGKKLHLAHFAGPIKTEWRDALEKTGVHIVCYIPNNAYLVYGDTAALAQAQTWAAAADFVQWDGDYADDYKIIPAARNTDSNGKPRDIGTDTFSIQLVDDPAANAATLNLINQLKLAPVQRQTQTLGYLNLIVALPAAQITRLAAQPDVVSIHPYFTPRKFCERQAQIMAGNLSGNIPGGAGYLAWLTSKGFNQAQFTASGFAVDVTDSGLDNGTTTPNHFGLFLGGSNTLSSRVVYARLEGSPNGGNSTIQGCDGHGNLNAHIIGGYNTLSGFPHADASGYHYGLGICPFIKVGSSVIFDPNNFTSPNYPNLISRAYRDAARISNNSWGADTAGAYNSDAQSYDALVRDAQPAGSAVPAAGNQEITIVFAAGNAGPNASTVGAPGTSKNVISVGAAENVQAFGGSDASGVSDTGADSANDIIGFSSRGPCSDGRIKPDICAPGTHVSGGVAQAASPAATGTAIACYDGTGVSGGVSSIYFPSAGQQFYTASSGTSHSTPGVAGACALVRQYFINQTLTPPSPAMTKAFLMNSARYMTGVSANDTLPSNNQGMGGVNLGTAFDGTARVLRDQSGADKFTSTGQIRTFTGTLTDTGKPFRITLAWTDAPGTTSGNAYNNNLDLAVTIGGQTYKGNVFSGANSVTGGTADIRNNAESVFIPAGVSGAFTVTVTAANINSDGVPNEAPALDQDFALVIYNATEATTPIISATAFNLTAETCAPTNGAIDPSETVTANLSLQNLGTASTTNLVVTLLATNGVTSPSTAQTYGALATNGAVVTHSFSFTANGTCGGNITPTFHLQDGATDLGNLTQTNTLGQAATLWSENFDGVTAPALPVGWSTSAGGAQTAWTTVTTQRDTLPNAAYTIDSANVGSNALVSAAVTLPTGNTHLTFRHRYEMEFTYDGGVLEIKIGGGAFTDILTAGGTFANGGYVTTLTTGSPLAGRAAWTGTNSTFTTVTVNLPAAASGQTVQFRWRSGTDSSVSRAGWWVDSVSVTGYACCTAPTAPIITTQPQNQNVLADNPANFSVAAAGIAPIACQWYFNSSPIPGAQATNYFIASAQASNAGNYTAILTNTLGAATSSVAVLTIVTAPAITADPTNLTITAGDTATFAAAATGTAPLAYQWRLNGTNISGANTNTYSKVNAQPANAGSYTLVVTNTFGAATSAPASLTVNINTSIFSGTLAGWDVSGQTSFGTSPLSPSTNAANIAVAGLTRGAGVTTSGPASSGAWGGNGWNYTPASNAVAANVFATCGVAANAGYKVSFSSISKFDYRRSSTGPPSGVIQYQVDSGAFKDITNVTFSTGNSGVSLAVVDLSGMADLQNVAAGTNVTFRIVSYGASGANGTWYVYDKSANTDPDFAIDGTVAPVIAPPAVAPTFAAFSFASNQFQFTLTGTAGSNYILQYSSNLASGSWLPLQTSTAPILFIETNTGALQQRFYRGKLAP